MNDDLSKIVKSLESDIGRELKEFRTLKNHIMNKSNLSSEDRLESFIQLRADYSKLLVKIYGFGIERIEDENKDDPKVLEQFPTWKLGMLSTITNELSFVND